MNQDYEREQDSQVFSFVSGLLLGAVIGAGIALLAAPEPGRKTRKRLRRAAVELKNSAGSHLDDLADEVKGKVDEVMKGARTRFVS
ncbi:MAG: YtxH domain-containing protein [Gemmatimonadales bacterium]